MLTEDNKPIWRQVAGPIAAIITNLADMGWQARHMEVWRDELNMRYVLDYDTPIHEVLDEVAASAERQLWKHAATGWHGEGMQLGIAKTTSFSLHKKY